MATDWAADVKKYDPSADDGVIAGIVRYCGIALRKVDSSLVSFSDPKETDRVRQNFLKKKLGLTEPDSVLDDAIAAVGDRMKGDRTKNRVTVYYLLAQSFGMLDQFAPKAKAAKATKASGAGTAAAAGAAGAAAMGLMGAADGKATPAESTKKAAAPKASKPKPAASLSTSTKSAAPAKKAATVKAEAPAAPEAAPVAATDNDDSVGGGVIAAGAAGLAAVGAAGVAAADAISGAGKAAVDGAKDLAGDTAEAAGDLARDAAAGVTAGVTATGAAVAGAAGAAAAGVASLIPGNGAPGSDSHGSTADDDGGFAWLWWLLAALLLIGLVWWLFFRQPSGDAHAGATASQTTASSNPVGEMAEGMAAGDTAPAGTAFAAAPAEGSVEIPAGAGVTSELRNGKPVVKVYFDTASTALAPAFADAAGGLKAWLAANPGTSLAVSGYNDSTGNAAANAELSKNRAFAVRDALIASGIAETSVETVKPEETTAGAGSDAAARRVEVVVR